MKTVEGWGGGDGTRSGCRLARSRLKWICPGDGEKGGDELGVHLSVQPEIWRPNLSLPTFILLVLRPPSPWHHVYSVLLPQVRPSSSPVTVAATVCVQHIFGKLLYFCDGYFFYNYMNILLELTQHYICNMLLLGCLYRENIATTSSTQVRTIISDASSFHKCLIGCIIHYLEIVICISTG